MKDMFRLLLQLAAITPAKLASTLRTSAPTMSTYCTTPIFLKLILRIQPGFRIQSTRRQFLPRRILICTMLSWQRQERRNRQNKRGIKDTKSNIGEVKQEFKSMKLSMRSIKRMLRGADSTEIV